MPLARPRDYIYRMRSTFKRGTKHAAWIWIPVAVFLAACATKGPGSGSADLGEGNRTPGDCPPADEVASEAPVAPADPGDTEVDRDNAGPDRDRTAPDAAQDAPDSFNTPIHICDIIVTGSSWSAGPQGVAGLRAFLEKVKLEHERLLMADVPPPQDVLAEIETLERELETAIASRTQVQPDTTVGTFP